MTHPSVNSIVERLEPCPFCGGAAHTTKEIPWGNLAALVMCTTNDCAVVGADTLDQAIKVWNTRPAATIISDLQAERDAHRLMSEKNYALWARECDARLAAESSLSRIKEETAPFGWKLVPAEPTDEMCSAMVSRIEEAMCGKGAPFKWPDIEHMFDIYVDAIAAAPTLRSLGSTDRSGSEKTAESEHSPSTREG